MNTTHRNTTQVKLPQQEWTWYDSTHWGDAPCQNARIEGGYHVLRVYKWDDEDIWHFGTPNGMGTAATEAEAKAAAIADVS